MPPNLESEQTGVHSECATISDDRSVPSGSAPDVGSTLGRYELVERLGAGAMGSVFSAHDPLLDRRVALKVLHPDRRGARGVQRLQREARALARLSHPNVVTINDVGVDGDRVYLAMELVEGRTLGAWLERDEQSWRRIVEVMRQAGEGLVAVHEAGLVHRDFKPENIMIAFDGRVLLADFGIALAESEAVSVEVTQLSAEIIANVSVEEGPRLTRTGALLGTPRYMAPEQFLKLPVSARADQWTFCAVLWEALFGMHPFGGETIPEIGLAVTTGAWREPPPGHRVPQSIVQTMLKGLSVSGNDRFASMRELLDRLDVGRMGRRRRWLAAGGVVGLGALGLSLSLAPSSEPPCDGPARMAEVWDDDRAARIERAFESASLPLAASTQGRVLAQIEDYRETWVASYVDACDAQRDADAEQRARLDRRFACLNERRDALEHLLGVLEDANDTVVTHAAGAVLGLESVQECDDWQDSDSSAVPLPADPDTRREVERVSALLGEVRALTAAGRYDDALVLARRAQSEGARVDHPPLHAVTALVLGLAEKRALEGDGYERFQYALEIASAEGMDTAVANAAMLLSMAQADRAQMDAAQLSLRHAEAALRRTGRSPELDTDFLAGEVVLCNHEGDYARCEQIQRRILSLSTEYYGARSVAAASAHGRLAHLVSERGRHAEAIQHFQMQREIEAEVLGPNHPLVAETLSRIQDQYRAQGDYERAREIDALVLPMMEAAYGPEHPGLLGTLVHRATLLAVDGDAEESLEYYDRALQIVERADGAEHPRVSALLANRSIILGRLARHEQAIADMRRALRIAEIHYEPGHPNLAVLYDNLGHALVEAGRASEAVPLHERALPIWEAQDRHSAATAISLTDHARALIGAGRPAEAAPMLERAIGIFGAHTIDPVEVARARFALARALADAELDLERARVLAVRARDVYRNQDNREFELRQIEAWIAEHGGPPSR